MQWCKLFLYFLSMSLFSSLSLSLSLLSYLFLINPVPFCVFTQHSILQFFFFRRLWSFYTSNHATYITHAVCKKLKFKRVLTLSLRMTAIWHVLISMCTRTMQEDVPFLLQVFIKYRKERCFMPYIDFSFKYWQRNAGCGKKLVFFGLWINIIHSKIKLN